MGKIHEVRVPAQAGNVHVEQLLVLVMKRLLQFKRVVVLEKPLCEYERCQAFQGIVYICVQADQSVKE